MDPKTAAILPVILEIILADPVIAEEQYRVIGNAVPSNRGGYEIVIEMIPTTAPLIPSDIVLADKLNNQSQFFATFCGPFNWSYRYQRQFSNGVWSDYSNWYPLVRSGDTCTSAVITIPGPYRWQMQTSNYSTDLVEVQ